MKTRHVILLILFAFLFIILLPEMPHEYSELPANLTENETSSVQLMSPQDDVPADDPDKGPGWWKHTGHSHVVYSSNEAEIPPSADNREDIPDPEEIPEFPTLAIPMLVVLGLAFMFQRKIV